MRSEQELFIAHAANIQVLSASQPDIFFLFAPCLLREPVTDRKKYMLLVTISAAVPKKSQQHLTVGCQLKEDTNYWYSACICKLRSFMCPSGRLTDRRLRLPFPDSSQWGVWRVVPVMAHLLNRSRWPGIITPGPFLLAITGLIVKLHHESRKPWRHSCHLAVFAFCFTDPERMFQRQSGSTSYTLYVHSNVFLLQ